MTHLDPTIDAIQRALRMTLENAYIRASAHATGQDPMTMLVEDRAAVLERYRDALRADMRVIHELLAQARALGASSIHAALCRAEGADPEMLDQALEYSREDHE